MVIDMSKVAKFNSVVSGITEGIEPLEYRGSIITKLGDDSYQIKYTDIGAIFVREMTQQEMTIYFTMMMCKERREQ